MFVSWFWQYLDMFWVQCLKVKTSCLMLVFVRSGLMEVTWKLKTTDWPFQADCPSIRVTEGRSLSMEVQTAHEVWGTWELGHPLDNPCPQSQSGRYHLKRYSHPRTRSFWNPTAHRCYRDINFSA